jgi:hypothetical protein
VAFCQDFDYDVFISYSHLNNASLGTEDKGWVTDLHEVLKGKLGWSLAKPPSIWRDEQGLEGRTINEGVRGALENSAIFLAIMSRGFLASTYCGPVELAGFRHPKFPLTLRDHSRIVVAVCESIQDVPRDTWPAELRDVPCVEFAEGTAGAYTRTARPDPTHPYWVRIEKLVRHITESLKEVQKGHGGAAVSQLTPPEVTLPKPAAAWQKRWLKPRVHITCLDADRSRADRLANELKAQCDVTLLPADTTDERRQRRYIENSDGHIVLFDCANRPWAEDQALNSITVAAEQGRPRRLAIYTDDVCLNDFAIKSEYVVPIGQGQPADEFVSSIALGR